MPSSQLLTPDFFKTLISRNRLPCFTNMCDNSTDDVEPWCVEPKIQKEEKSCSTLYVPPHRRGSGSSNSIFKLIISDKKAAKLIGPRGIEIKKIYKELAKFSTKTKVIIDDWNNGEDRTVTIISSCEFDRKKALEIVEARLNS